MFTSRLIVPGLLVIAAAATANAASDESCTRETLKPVAAPTRVLEAAGPAIAPLDGMELLVVRIGPDGKPVMACVDSLEAAKKFFEAPIEKTARRAKEK
jgi:hypothetical protein